MFGGVHRWLGRRSPEQVSVLGLALVGLLGAIDHATGYELSFSIFYLAPIILVTWYAGPRPGYLLCLLSAIVWAGVDVTAGHPYSHVFFPVWNGLVRLGFFVVTAYLLGRLRAQLSTERTLARTDGLTQILNARAFREACGGALTEARRRGATPVLGYIDLDDFKAVNDKQGHAEGDRVLHMVATTLKKCVRSTDLVGRMGGDEFAVLLPDAGLAPAKIVFERIHKDLLQNAREQGWPVGFSIGVAVLKEAPASVEAALSVADRLMYRVKKSGKNSVVYEQSGEAKGPEQPTGSAP